MAKKKKTRIRQVWRFIEYEDRWGYECDGLPKYFKWYINGWKECEGAVITALNELRSDNGFIFLQGALVELLTLATNTEEQYQGYILNSRHNPATATDVGRMLRYKGRGSHNKALAVLRRLSMAGFLEEVPWGSCGFSPDREGPDKGNVTQRVRNVTTSQKKKRRRIKPGSRANKGGKTLKGKGKLAAQEEKVKAEQGSAKRSQSRRQHLKSQMDEMLAQRTKQGGTATVTTPATAPSMSSTIPDAGQARQQDQSDRMPALSSSSQIGAIVKLSAHRYDPDGWQFADDVLVATGYLTVLAKAQGERDGYSPAQSNERAHWAKAWHTAKGQFDGDSLRWLRRQVLKRADAVGRDRGSKHNPESYLMRAWHNLVKDLRKKRTGTANAG
jgi:hypothetical protein